MHTIHFCRSYGGTSVNGHLIYETPNATKFKHNIYPGIDCFRERSRERSEERSGERSGERSRERSREHSRERSRELVGERS